MYTAPRRNPTTIETNNTYKGETIEKKIERITESGEPISDRAEMIYTDRKEGVLPAYDIRTDKHVIAIDAMDVASKSNTAKREHRHKPKEEPKPEPKDQPTTEGKE